MIAQQFFLLAAIAGRAMASGRPLRIAVYNPLAAGPERMAEIAEELSSGVVFVIGSQQKAARSAVAGWPLEVF